MSEELLRLLKGGEAQRDFVCPHCSVHSIHTPQSYAAGTEVRVYLPSPTTGKAYPRQVNLTHVVYRCIKCQKDTYILSRPPVEELPEQIIHQHPTVIPVLHEAVPAEVRRATIEADKCLSTRAPNACGVMARRAIHAICQDMRAEGKDLHDQLKFLRDAHQITPDLWKWAEELRIVGRSGAHPEWEDVSPEEADYAVRFLREIIRYVYINPFERDQRKLKETKKKKNDPGTIIVETDPP